ncbi:MAG: hypothetical protein WA871_11425 [Candidatus Acidiferrales bacterium]
MSLSRSGKIGVTSQRALRACLGIILVAACLVAPVSNYAVTVKHQATGTIQSHTASAIVLLKTIGKHQSQWDFVLTHATQIPLGVNKGVRVTIYYHEDGGKRIADRIKIVAVTTTKKTG